MPDLSAIKNAPDISFIDNRTVFDIRAEMVADYEKFISEATGETITLGRASPHRMEIYSAAAQIYQCMVYTDRAGKLNLLKYSYSDWLDNVALLKGVTRLPAAAASTTLCFTLSAARPGATGIPQGTRVAANEAVYFATSEYAEIPAGQLAVDVPATCTVEGVSGNGFDVGALYVIVDPIPYVASVSNITKTEGGADIESDEDLAIRAHIAPSSYSTAGPEGAYEYWVRTYSAAIGDVKITSDQKAGTVDIYFLMEDGSEPGEEMVNGLLEYLQNGDFRPMDDLVTAGPPVDVPYTLDFRYFIGRSNATRAVSIQTAVNAAVNQYLTWQRKIGRDINPDELTTVVKMAGAKRLEIVSPVFTTVGDNNVSKLIGAPVIRYGGLEND